jgi:hypothetical protein
MQSFKTQIELEPIPIFYVFELISAASSSARLGLNTALHDMTQMRKSDNQITASESAFSPIPNTIE